MNEESKYIEQYYNYILEKIEPESKELRAVFDIIYDITDRRGLKQEFRNIDCDIQDEIIEKWLEIIKKVTI